MKQIRTIATVSARILIAAVFLVSGLGLVDQSISVHEMVARGIPVNLAPALSMVARIIEVIAGVGLALGLYPGICAGALIAFLIPATLIGHPFWIAPSQLFQVQLINFLKNFSMIGGLLFIASTSVPTKFAVAVPLANDPLAER